MYPQAKLMYAILIVGLLVGPIAGCASMGGSPGGEGSEFAVPLELKPVPHLAEPYKGQRVTVVSFPDKTVRSSKWWRPSLGRASTDYLVEFLMEAGFRVVEGQSGQLDALLQEVEFGQTGMVDESTAVEIGEMLGAELVSVGAVTDYKQVKTGGKSNLQFASLGFQSGEETINYVVQASGRIVNIKTRETIAAATASYKNRRAVSGGGFQFGDIKFQSGEEMEVQEETSGRLFQKALNELTIKIVTKLNRRSES